MGKSVVKREEKPVDTKRLTALAGHIERHHKAAYQQAAYALKRARQCGECLNEAKQLVKHGEWAAWMRDNISLSERQAQKYMQIAKGWPKIMEEGKDKTALGADLPINDAVALLAKPRPEPSPSPNRRRRKSLKMRMRLMMRLR